MRRSFVNQEEKTMSAYLCSPEHIGQLALAMQQKIPVANKPMWAKDLASLLAFANWESVEDRYGEEEAKSMNDGYSVTVYQAQCADKAYGPDISLKPIDLIKMAKGFAYQACESDSWEAANWDSDFIGKWHIDYFISVMLSKLPGYDEAPWEYTKKADAPVVKLVG